MLITLLTLSACDFGVPETAPAPKVTPPVAEKAKVIAAPIEAGVFSVVGGSLEVETIKNGAAPVKGNLGELKGTFHFDDAALRGDITGELEVPLSSWDSGLELRDQRVQDLFFKVATNPSLSFSLTGFSSEDEDGVGVGESIDGIATGFLDVRSKKIEISTKVSISRSAPKRYSISSVEPFTVSVEDMGLTKDMEALIKACGHASVDDAIKISLNLDLGPKTGGGTAKPLGFKGKLAPGVNGRTRIKGKAKAARAQRRGE
jgi:hypothetical protein